VEEGVVEVAPALGGGTDPLVTRVKETGIAEVTEATEGEIINTMPGAFCLLKESLQLRKGSAAGRAHLLLVDLLAMRI
jgi:hypothetical protein